MKDLKDFVLESKDGFNSLKPILKKTGWPSLKINGDKAISEDEDTTITFELDDWDNKPFISEINCKFVSSDPVHLRDLNGLVELFKEIQNI